MSIKAISHVQSPSNIHRSNNTQIQKREFHKAKSHSYVQEYLKNPSHSNQFQSLTKAAKVHLYPKTVTTILKAESTLCEQGLVTAVHATPAAFTPAIQLATKCELVKNKSVLHKSIDTFAVVRDPALISDHYTQMMHILQVLNDKSIVKPDHNPLVRDRVLSMSYGLFTNIRKGESAFYYGFKNWSVSGQANPDFAKKKAVTMIENTLTHYGFAHKEIKEIVSSMELSNLLEDFHSLKTGNFLVYGIPRAIARKSLYDSHPFGVPTGDDVLQVFDGAQGKDRIADHQARFVLSKETMDANSGITVISCLDEHGVVDPYLRKNKEKAFMPPCAYKEFNNILPSGSTEVENDEIGKRKVFLERSRIFAHTVASGIPSK